MQLGLPNQRVVDLAAAPVAPTGKGARVVSPWLAAADPPAPPPADAVRLSTPAAAAPAAPREKPGATVMQAVVTAFSLAMMMACGSAVAETAADPAALSALSKTVHAHKRDGSSDDGGDSGTNNGVPWYDPVEQRAKDINDGFHTIRDGLDSFTTRANQRLNDNPLGRYHAQGTLEGYHWTFDPMTVHVAPYLTLQANQAGLGARSEASLLRGSMTKASHVGEWTVTHGLRGEVLARRDYGRGTSIKLSGFSADNLDNKFFGPRVETFEQWKRAPLHHWTMSVDVNAGVSDDFSSHQDVAYARSLQRFENDVLPRPWLGAGSKVRVELEEGLQHNLHDGSTSPYYRMFGGASKPIRFQLKGKSHVVDLEVGARVVGNRDQHAAIHPEVRARLRW